MPRTLRRDAARPRLASTLVVVSAEVAERLRALIRDAGPITFARYMDEALYGPGGFYRGAPVSVGGDFVTSPHVHPIFSRLVGAGLEELWTHLGRPVPFRVVEVGAGDGTMAREIVAGFGRAGIELVVEAVEASPEARGALEGIVANVAGTIEELGPLEPGVVVANELLDNLPFRRVRNRDGTLLEIRVGLDGDRLVEVETPGDPDLAAEAPALPSGGEATVPVGAFAFVERLAARLGTGYALLIDYGSAGGPAGEVHGYRSHRLLGDVLDDPGSADITAGVDLSAVAARARREGLVAFEAVSQRSALRALGLDEWMRAERTRQAELLDGDRALEAVRTWGSRSRAGLLVDPTGLGRLWWLLLATSGLPEPGWLSRARALDAEVR